MQALEPKSDSFFRGLSLSLPLSLRIASYAFTGQMIAGVSKESVTTATGKKLFRDQYGLLTRNIHMSGISICEKLAAFTSTALASMLCATVDKQSSL